MPTTDDYIKAISEKRDKGETAKVDFAQIPEGVDTGKIAKALSDGIPDEYGQAIQDKLKNKQPLSLNYGVVHVKQSVPEKVWDTVKGPLATGFKAMTTPIPGLKQVGEKADELASKGIEAISPTEKQVEDEAAKTGNTPYGKVAERVAAQTAAAVASGLIPRSPLDIVLTAGGMKAGSEIISTGGRAIETGESVLARLGEGKTIAEAAKELGVPEKAALDAVREISESAAAKKPIPNISGAVPTKKGIPAEPIENGSHADVGKALAGDAPSQVKIMKLAIEKYAANLKKVFGPTGEVLGFNLNGSEASSTAHNLFDRRFGDIGVGLFEAGLFRRDTTRALAPLEKQALPFVIEGLIPQPERFVHPQAKEILELAQNPTPAMKEAVSKIGPYLKEGHSFLKEQFEELGFKDNYISHIWDKGGDNFFGPGKQSLSKRNPFTNKRWIGSYAEGINMGLTPKTLDIEQILEHYDNYKVRSVANAKFTDHLKELQVLKTLDKAPADWVRIDHPSIARKVFIPGKGPDDPGFFTMRPVAVHPDFAPAVKAIIDKPFSNEGVRALEMFNAAYKKSLFSFSLFHHFTLSTIDLAAGGNPLKVMGRTFAKRFEEAGLGDENPFKAVFGRGEDGVLNAKKLYQSFRDGHAGYDNVPLARDAIQHGLNVNPLSDAQVGRVRQGLISLEQGTKNIPVVGTAVKAFRTYDELFDKGLWSYMHAGVKLDLYERHLADNLAKFPDMPVEQLKRQTAEFVNNAAGGALDGMMISPKFQQSMHWLMIAPDFLLTRMNSFASIFKGGPVGYQARKMWLKAGVAYYSAANVMNYVNTQKAYGKGQFMWQNDSEHQLTPFMDRVESGPGKGRQVFLKLDKAFTEPIELIMNPKKVLGNKFSPYLNAMALYWTGRTMSGYKPPNDVTPGIYVKQAAPMTLRGASEFGVFPKISGMSQTDISTRLAKAVDQKDSAEIKKLVDVAKKNGYDGAHIERQVRKILTDEKRKALSR